MGGKVEKKLERSKNVIKVGVQGKKLKIRTAISGENENKIGSKEKNFKVEIENKS